MRSRPALLLTLAALFATDLSAQPGGRHAGGRPTGGDRPSGNVRGTAGMVSPRAIGPAAPTPVPLGGLRTRPLTPNPSSVVPRLYDRNSVGGYRGRDDHRDRDRDGYRDRDRRGPNRGYGYGYDYGVRDGYRLGVTDAPILRGGIVYGPHGETRSVPVRTWFPTSDRPRWRVDFSLTPVQAWRDLIVTDVVCDGYGACMERDQRVRAPWVPVCRCYLFTDALGRRWEIE